MKKYELLKQLQMEAAKLQLEKERAMETIKELCDEWNLTLSNKEEQIINNIITINKGKIIAVENNELQEAYDVLAENFKNRCERIEELKDELFGKELLLNEFRDKVDEDIKTIHALEDKVEELKDELEIKDAIIENLKARLRVAEEIQHKEVVKYEHIEIVDDPLYNEPIKEEEESDEMPLFNIPKEYKDKPEIKEIVERRTNEYNNAKDQMFGGRLAFTREQMQKKIKEQADKEIAMFIEEQMKMDQYKLNYKPIYNEKLNTLVAAQGTITLANKEYTFKYGATHTEPCIYGCMDMNLIREAKEVLDKTIHIIKDDTEQKHAYEVIYAFDKGIVVWQTDDGAFKGYTKEYAFVWDGTSAVPCGTPVKHATNENKPYRKMNASWGNGFVKRAEMIKEFCRTIDKSRKTTKEELNVTKDIELNVTKDIELNVAKEIDELDI